MIDYEVIDKLDEILYRLVNDNEQRFLVDQEGNYDHFYKFYNYLYFGLFPFISHLDERNNKLAWKVTAKGVSIYVSKERESDGRFMSVDFQKRVKLKYEFYQGKSKFNIAELLKAGDEKHCWLKREYIGLDPKIVFLIQESYNRKVDYLKNNKGFIME